MQCKYGNRKTIIDGFRFDSIAEGAFYSSLKLMKKAKKIDDFELQPKYVLQDSFKHNGKTFRAITYTADFLVTRGEIQDVIDVKGMSTEVFKLKMKLFIKKYGNLVVTKDINDYLKHIKEHNE
jgi:hypothetical protein